MKASDLFLKCLEAQGVKTIYGVPGEENADLMMSLLNSSIGFISTRHEQTAAFMAEMHGRLTGIPGVCLATLGPGATNLITGVAQANMDNAPLVAIIGQAESSRLHKESHQNMDSVSMFKPITKWATTIREADSIPEVIAKAFKIATSGIPGAVLIELPEDIASHETNSPVLKSTQTPLAIGTTPELIQKVLACLAQSKKPLLLLGDGAVREEADFVIREFMDKTGFYATYTFMGKGVIPHNHDRSLHCVGLGMKDFVIQAFEQSDCVLAIGYDMVEYSPSKWNVGVSKKIIHINNDIAEVDASYIPDIEIVGSIKIIMGQLNQALAISNQANYRDAYFKDMQDKIRSDVRSDLSDSRFPMTPKRILQDIRQTLGEDDMLVSDVGAHKMWVARQYGAMKSKTCFISNGFCSMGGSMPGALEAKRLNPNLHVLALCGDGGFMMSIQALCTGVTERIPFIVILWDDGNYGLIKWKQQMHFGKYSHVDLHNGDLAQIAQSFGAHGIKIKNTEEFIPELKKAFEIKDRPSVIVVPVDYSENMKLFEHLKEHVK